MLRKKYQLSLKNVHLLYYLYFAWYFFVKLNATFLYETIFIKYT